MVESFVSHLSVKNAERMGHPVLYVVRARSFTDLRPFRMTVGVGWLARWYCAARAWWDPALLVESFVSHPFRKKNAERVGHPAPPSLYLSTRGEITAKTLKSQLLHSFEVHWIQSVSHVLPPSVDSACSQ